MTDKAIITFYTNPTNFKLLIIVFFNDSVLPDFYYSILKTFITGVPVSGVQVRIGATLEDTIDNLYTNLITYNADPNVQIVNRSSEGILEFNFLDNRDYDFTLTENANTIDADATMITTTTPVVIAALDPLDIKDFSIKIIDTYTNNLPMVVEFPRDAACKIEWNSGDDLLKELMPSKLDFNMVVPSRKDANFIHLVTGDEKRYRVELNAIDASNNVQLVWQGFLLPDQYKEPFTSGVLFVDFVATDNLATLKGKYLDPWFYYNKFPIAELFAMILKMTGLSQDLLISPSLMTAAVRTDWYYINVDLRPYYNGKKFEDVYKIITDVLKANLLTLKNYRGFWWIEGATRRKDETGEMYRFDDDGKYIGQMEFVKLKKESMILEGSATVTVVTPWKKVNFDFNAKGDKNMLPDTVAVLEEKDMFFTYNTTAIWSPGFQFADKYFKNWNFNFNSDFAYNFFKEQNANYRVMNWLSNGEYHYTEAEALSNYIQCKETAFVKPGVLYAFEMEFFALGITSSSDPVSSLNYDKIVPWQILMNGVEMMSNRPSFDSSGRYSYIVTNAQNPVGVGNGSSFKIRYEFRVDVPGYLSFRILVPIGEILYWSRIHVRKLKLEIVEDYDITESLSGVRNINFTQELDYDVAFTCTQDKSVENSLGLGLPVDSNYYTELLSAGGATFTFQTQHFFPPATTLDLDLLGWDINDYVFDLLFVEGWKRACFLEKATGERIPFDNLYGSASLQLVKRAAFLTDYDGYPVIPKNYFKYGGFTSTDSVSIMYVKYGPEDFTQRLYWKIYGSSTVDEFKKILISAIHNINPESLYRFEGQLLDRIFPDDLFVFYFDNEERNFIPSKVTIDLFNTKTTLVGTEAKYEELTDITFE